MSATEKAVFKASLIVACLANRAQEKSKILCRTLLKEFLLPSVKELVHPFTSRIKYKEYKQCKGVTLKLYT